MAEKYIALKLAVDLQSFETIDLVADHLHFKKLTQHIPPCKFQNEGMVSQLSISAEDNALDGPDAGGGPLTGLVGKLMGVFRRFWRKDAAGGSAVSRSSPSRARGTPYSSSAADTL